MDVVNNMCPSYVIMQQGEREVHCEVLFSFEDQQTGNTIIAFTDRTQDSTGNIRIYGAKQQEDGLVPLQTEDEYALMQEVLDEIRRTVAHLPAN